MRGDADAGTVREAAAGLFLIDTLMSNRPGYTSVFLARGERAAILDAGVSVTAENILRGVEEAGTGLDDVAYIALTHAHYDHAGGAHELLRLLRKKGNREVRIACSIKPSVYLSRADICEKLMKSGRSTEGPLVGEMSPIPREEFVVMEDGDELELGGVTVRAVDSPGHANGHLAFHLPELDFLFAGDACGLLAQDESRKPVIAPTAFAPEYRGELYMDTVRKIADMGVRRVGFGHFGMLEEPDRPLEQAVVKAQWLHSIVSEMEAGAKDRESVLDSLEQEFGPALISLYPSRERMRLAFKSMITGVLNDMSRV
jgi:glyoxylase-like metal-dependent hydrolase (beta-lactamase superfamily II)